MKNGKRGGKGIPAIKDREAYQWELGLEQQRIRRKRALDALKDSEKRETLEKAGQGNLFAPKADLSN